MERGFGRRLFLSTFLLLIFVFNLKKMNHKNKRERKVIKKAAFRVDCGATRQL